MAEELTPVGINKLFRGPAALLSYLVVLLATAAALLSTYDIDAPISCSNQPCDTVAFSCFLLPTPYFQRSRPVCACSRTHAQRKLRRRGLVHDDSLGNLSFAPLLLWHA